MGSGESPLIGLYVAEPRKTSVSIWPSFVKERELPALVGGRREAADSETLRRLRQRLLGGPQYPSLLLALLRDL